MKTHTNIKTPQNIHKHTTHRNKRVYKLKIQRENHTKPHLNNTLIHANTQNIHMLININKDTHRNTYKHTKYKGQHT